MPSPEQKWPGPPPEPPGVRGPAGPRRVGWPAARCRWPAAGRGQRPVGGPDGP